MTAEIKHVPGDGCAACAADLAEVADAARQLAGPTFRLPMPDLPPEHVPQWARELLEHVTTDIHNLAGLQNQLENRILELWREIKAARSDIAELAGKVAGLEEEFGPLARKFSTTAGRLSATGAAAFTRRRANIDTGRT